MIPTTGRKDRSVHPAKQTEQGAALVVALIVMSLLAALTVGSLEMLTTNVQIAGNHARELRATYIADAGIEDAIDRLRDDPDWDAGLIDIEFPSGSGNFYTVAVDNSEYPLVKITATGEVTGFQRSLEAQVRITGSSAPYSISTVYWKEI